MTPTNALTKKEYTGGNIAELQGAGYIDNTWATYRQWKSLGYQVQKGQKGTKIIKIVKVERKNKTTGEIKEKRVPKTYTVFNIAQVAEIEE